MDELELLRNQKIKWLKEYEPYALTLCLAVLAIGIDDDMDDPTSIRRHHMTCKSVNEGEVTIIATEKNGGYLVGASKFSTTRRLIVNVGIYQPVYMTFTNDPSIGDAGFNTFVPGFWFNYADEIISRFAKMSASASQTKEKEEINKLKKNLLIDVPGFGTSFSKSNEKEVDY